MWVASYVHMGRHASFLGVKCSAFKGVLLNGKEELSVTALLAKYCNCIYVRPSLPKTC